MNQRKHQLTETFFLKKKNIRSLFQSFPPYDCFLPIFRHSLFFNDQIYVSPMVQKKNLCLSIQILKNKKKILYPPSLYHLLIIIQERTNFHTHDIKSRNKSITILKSVNQNRINMQKKIEERKQTLNGSMLSSTHGTTTKRRE